MFPSFYEMNCLLEKEKAKRVQEAIQMSPEEVARRQKMVAAMKAKQGAGAPPVMTQAPVDAQVTAPEAPVGGGVADLIAKAKATQGDTPAVSKVRSRKPRPTEGPAGNDPNDPNFKKYGVRGSGGVGGNTNNLGGLAQAAGGARKAGNTVSKQMTDVPDQNRQRVLLARLADKVQQFNSVMRNYPTMRFFARIAMAGVGYGPLKHLGADALEKYAAEPEKSVKLDQKLVAPFEFTLQKDAGEKDNKFGDLSANQTDSLPKQYIPRPKDMIAILKNCQQYMSDATHYERPKQDGQAAPAAAPKGPSGPSPEDMAAVKGAAGALPEAQSWMDVHELMEHWQF